MSLSSALDISRSSLATTAQLSEIVSRNIANASNSSATRKVASVVTDVGGGARVSQVIRAAVGTLRDGVIGATSDAALSDVVSTALDQLDLTGGQSTAASPASQLSALRASLQTLSANPSDPTAAAGVVNAAKTFVSTLHQASQNVLAVRQQADSDINDAVADINTKLKQISDLNGQIVNGTIANTDVTDQLDARDQLVAGIAQQIGVQVISRGNNSIAIYTDSGTTLFDGQPRSVSVQQVPVTDGAPGGVVVVDGVPAIGQNAIVPISSGRLVGLVQVRDQIGLTYGAQLDDIATSAIRAFRETDQGTPPTLGDALGLLTSSTLSGVPAAGSANPGLARSISVNANVDPASGGNVLLLRDGGISDPTNPAYKYNTTGATGYTGRVSQLVDALGASDVHDPATALPASSSVIDFAANSLGYLQGQRQTATQNSTNAQALLQRAQGALSKDGGVNIDDELTNLLGLEQTYQASAKIISTVDNLFTALLQAFR